ncbi:MAG: hypothetical protein D6683_06490 [Actinomyces sp.]|nr:MAG: hypothetical protein D6683_06490 [Actinomyces sp.]
MVAAAAALVVAVAGSIKLAAPDAAAALLDRLGVPRSRVAARLVGGGEIALAAAVLAVGGRAAHLALAAVYMSFAVVVVTAGAAGITSCACFGSASGALHPLHALVDVLAAVVATGAAVDGGSIGAVVAASPAAPAVVVVILATAGMVLVALTALPDVLVAGREEGR